ncbi:NAD-dependent epimerase/dehydratase family protein [Streptomyces sp. NPDC026672]|uniref:NAD-dependent epimerase/dehydratase family protein n=1 Tax=unclassified Streptomyces TaxID=2593676 RepID=UPI0033D5F573
MKVVLFGGSGMVGQGVLRECLRDERVTSVVSVGRRPLDVTHPKLRHTVHPDLSDLTAIAGELTGTDACFHCLGATSAGRSEEEYRRVNHTFPLAAARAVERVSPGATFVYVSGEGADPTGTSRTMWARVRGETENDLLATDLHTYVFRPGYIAPRHGERSRTGSYRLVYTLTSWTYPLLRRVLPAHVSSTENIGRAMLATVALGGAGPHVLHSAEINRLGEAAGPE